ncbi:MAG: DegT/DnrJ/EryC1/StrS aminotransferase family protein [Kiritimatiellae bacterium]|nr:DegT/DnrJ/EryC1/StrS aminotransferase family protein [Kiritimatiellia bacterium]
MPGDKNTLRVGGEMEIPLDDLIAAAPAQNLHWSPPGAVPVATGRTALRLTLQAVPDADRRTALLPSYLCPSILQAFREEKWSIAFYRIRDDLTLDVGHLVDMLRRMKADVVLFINYFGFSPSSAEREALFSVRGEAWLIEDCVQSGLGDGESMGIGSLGDFAFTSYRKYLPVPDGGLLTCPEGIKPEPLAPWPLREVQDRVVGKLLRHEVRQRGGSDVLEAAYLDLFARAERRIDSATPMSGMSVLSEGVAARTDWATVRARRRANYSALLQAFETDQRLAAVGQPLIPALPDGITPLAFPIRVAKGRRDIFRQRLIERGVFCPVHWRLPPDVDSTSFSGSVKLSAEILSLPVDQRYEPSDMGIVADRILAVSR